MSEAQYNTGKGVIVDSGTTDTYLPRSIAPAFKRRFKDLAKRDYANAKMTLSEKVGRVGTSGEAGVLTVLWGRHGRKCKLAFTLAFFFFCSDANTDAKTFFCCCTDPLLQV